jgi:phenylpyruvate tautomerase PptA (4-oxalocrotonate tautomerase family)
MIDVYAAKGTFDDKLALTEALNHALIRWEKVPLISWFLDNTAAFIHELAPDAPANASRNNNCVRIQVLTPARCSRSRKANRGEMTDIVAAAANDPGPKRRTWVQIVEAPDGGWGIDGRAYANSETC